MAMKSPVRWAILLLLSVTLFNTSYAVPPATPNKPVTIGKVWIIAIGVSRYTNQNYVALKAAKDGAEQVARALYEAQPSITQPPTVLTPDALDDFDHPTRGFIRAKFADLEKLLKPADRVVVYFSGHGIEVAGKPYLLLMDLTNYRNLDLLKDGSISVEELRSWMNNFNCRERILFLDACRVDALEVSGDADINNTSKPFSDVTLNALGTQGSKTVTLFGCQPGERVYYGTKGLSFFTEALLEGLQGEGKAVNRKGQITMASLGSYVQDRVQELANDQNKAQKPAMYPAVLPTDALVLRPGPPIIACPIFSVNDKNDLEAKYKDSFTERFTTELVASQEVAMVERTRLDQVMRELRLQTSGLTDALSAKRLGQVVNADYLIVGTVREVPGKLLSINVRLVETAFGQVVPGCAAACDFDPADPTQWKRELLFMADQLLDAMHKQGVTNGAGSDPGKLRVVTIPPGAKVSLDGKWQEGLTPLTIKKLPPGAKVALTITQDGYETYDDVVTIGTGMPVPINLVRLQGAIIVKSSPVGAKVFLDGVERGVTSADGLTLSNLPVGNYAVTLRQSGYREESQHVDVIHKTNSDVLFTLQELPKPTMTVDLRCKTPLLAAGYKVYGAPAFGDGAYWAACATVKNTGVIPLANLKITYTFGAYGSWTSPRQYATLAPGDEIVDKAYPAFAEAMLTVATRKSIPVTVTVAFSAPEKPNLSQSATGQVLLLGTTEFSFADSEAKLSARWKDQFINAPFLSLFLTPTDRSVVAFADLAVQLMNAPGAPANAAGLDARRYCQALYELLRANNVTCNETSEFLVNPDASGNVQYPRQTLGTHKGTSLDLSLLFASACLAKGLPAHVLVKLGQALVVVSLPDATVFAIDLSVLGDSKRGRDGFAGAVKSGNAANKITLENGESLCYAITVDKQLSIPPPNPDEKPPINLGRLQGAITVKSTPIGAKVFLDGVERGVTSVDGLTLSNLPVGNYAVTLRQNGYREESQQVQVNYMTARDVLFTLQELPKPTLTVDLRCKTPLLAAGYKVYGAPAFGDGGYWAACATVKNTGVIPLANLKLTYTFGAYGSWTSPRQYATLAPGAEITDKAYPAFAEAMLTVATRKSIPVTVTVAFSAPEKPNLSQRVTGQALLLGTTEFSFTDSEGKLSTRWKDQFSNAPFLSLFLTPTDRPVVEFADLAVQLMNATGTPANAAGLDVRRYCQALYELLYANNVTCEEPRGFLMKPEATDNVQYPRQTLETHKGTSLDLSMLFASVCLAKGIPAQVVIMRGEALAAISLPDTTVFAIDLSGLGTSKVRDGFTVAVKTGTAIRMINLKSGASLSYTIACDKPLEVKLLSAVLAPLRNGILGEWHYQLPRAQAPPAAGKSTPVIFY